MTKSTSLPKVGIGVLDAPYPFITLQTTAQNLSEAGDNVAHNCIALFSIERVWSSHPSLSHSNHWELDFITTIA